MPSEQSRILALDVLRGVAVMAILAMNIGGFAMPLSAYFNPLAYGGDASDVAVWFTNFVLVDGKMRGLFSLLFGASMLLIAERAEASGLSAARVHARRMAWLLLFGLAHFYLIWFGDILALYAVVGLFAFAFRGLGARTLVVFAAIAFAGQIAIMAHASWGLFAWNAQSARLRPLTGAALADHLALYKTGGYADLVHLRATRQWLVPFYQMFYNGFEALGFMLLGMAGLKSGFLTGDWKRTSLRRLALWTLGVSIPASAAHAWLDWRSGVSPELALAIPFVAAVPFRALMAIGYAALILLWIVPRSGPLVRRIAAAGRVAFTNYIATSIAMTTLFYGYGFGWYLTLDRARQWLVVIAACVVMLLWSKPWLDRFRYGPLEWLWRSLARWELQPMRR